MHRHSQNFSRRIPFVCLEVRREHWDSMPATSVDWAGSWWPVGLHWYRPGHQSSRKSGRTGSISSGTNRWLNFDWATRVPCSFSATRVELGSKVGWGIRSRWAGRGEEGYDGLRPLRGDGEELEPHDRRTKLAVLLLQCVDSLIHVFLISRNKYCDKRSGGYGRMNVRLRCNCDNLVGL